MSLKRIRRRLSQTFRFSIEGSLSELAEHLTIEDGAEVKENGKVMWSRYAQFGGGVVLSCFGLIINIILPIFILV